MKMNLSKPVRLAISEKARRRVEQISNNDYIRNPEAMYDKLVRDYTLEAENDPQARDQFDRLADKWGLVRTAQPELAPLEFADSGPLARASKQDAQRWARINFAALHARAAGDTTETNELLAAIRQHVTLPLIEATAAIHRGERPEAHIEPIYPNYATLLDDLERLVPSDTPSIEPLRLLQLVQDPDDIPLAS